MEQVKQEYTPEYEDTGRKLMKRPTEIIGDVFDMYGMASEVHSDLTTMTRDYVLAKYTSEVINAKFPKFVREQRKVVRILKSVIIPPTYVLQQKYKYEKNPKEKAKQVQKAVKKIYRDIEKLLIGEVDEMVIISRADRGQVISSMLKHGKTKEELDEMESEMRPDNIKTRLTEKT